MAGVSLWPHSESLPWGKNKQMDYESLLEEADVGVESNQASSVGQWLRRDHRTGENCFQKSSRAACGSHWLCCTGVGIHFVNTMFTQT